MAIFVDLDEAEDADPHSHVYMQGALPVRNAQIQPESTKGANDDAAAQTSAGDEDSASPEDVNWTPATEALGCYPIIMAVASSIDLNTLDSLARTCHRVRNALLPYRRVLLRATLHCAHDQCPIDQEETLRFRVRAAPGTWHYMEDFGRSASRGQDNEHAGKAGQCARDMVSDCRRCGVVVCRNCTIKPPAPKALEERHRRLCPSCVKAPIGATVHPPQNPNVTLDSDVIQRSTCHCESAGVWLCQPCGRRIRGDDFQYRALWRWRYQYGEVLGGLGTGIGEGDRGVPCAREANCCNAKEQQQETDCDAEDARELDEIAQYGTSPSYFGSGPSGSNGAGAGASGPNGQSSLVPPWITRSSTPDTPASPGSHHSNGSNLNLHLTTYQHHGHPNNNPVALMGTPETPAGELGAGVGGVLLNRTPSPGAALGPGYARHEIEGIGGRVKTLRARTVRVGACVPDVEAERTGAIPVLGSESSGRVRSFCGWCWRVIPGLPDREFEDRRKSKRHVGSGEAPAPDMAPAPTVRSSYGVALSVTGRSNAAASVRS